MKIITILFLLAFFLKLLWNVWFPYVLERRQKLWQAGQGQKPRAVSMMLFVELLFLSLSVVSSAVSLNEGILGRPKDIAVYGGLAIIASYLISILLTRFARKSQ